MNTCKKWATTVALVGAVGTSQAALIDRGGGMIYDTTLNITWLSDWNYAVTSGYVVSNAGGFLQTAVRPNGRMGGVAAKDWAYNLVHGGYSDWRLPSSLNADGSGPCGAGYNCSGSEMGHMFYVDWGASAGNNFSIGANAANLALFTNIQSVAYWSGTLEATNAAAAWYFTMEGLQTFNYTDGTLYAVAVRDGDVAAAVPEPQTLALVLLGLGAAIFGWRHRVGRRGRVLRRLGIAGA